MSRDGQGYPYTPGIFTPEQIAGWKKITDAVHAKVKRHAPPTTPRPNALGLLYASSGCCWWAYLHKQTKTSLSRNPQGRVQCFHHTQMIRNGSRGLFFQTNRETVQHTA